MLKEALSDLYNSGVQDDTLHLIYEANKNVSVPVKTSFGLTEEVALEEAVLQWEVWGPSLAANQVDTFGKEMIEEDYSFMYRYKGYVPVPVSINHQSIINQLIINQSLIINNSSINHQSIIT